MLALDWLFLNRKWTLINVPKTLVPMVSMRIPHIICVEGDTDIFCTADKGGNPSFQCKMTFNLSTSTAEIDGLSLRWLWCCKVDITILSTWQCADVFWGCYTFLRSLVDIKVSSTKSSTYTSSCLGESFVGLYKLYDAGDRTEACTSAYILPSAAT